MKLLLILRASLYWLVFAVTTVAFALTTPILWLLPETWRRQFMLNWTRLNVGALKLICGLSYRVHGLENLPKDQAFIIFSNHQSTFETFFLQLFLPRFTWVLKRELLFVPFFGWGLKMLNPIAINRGSGKLAMDQLLKQGQQRLDDDFNVLIFPEGTRVPPNQKKRFKMGGALLAEKTQYPVLPIVHNAGYFWRKGSFIKYPGTVDVVIGPLQETTGKSAQAINHAAEEWIRERFAELPVPPHYHS